MTKPLEALINRAKHIVENGGLLARDTSLALIAALEQAQQQNKELESTLEREREKSRRVMSHNQKLEGNQLAVKLPGEYPDDGELSFCIDLYDEPERDLRLAMWLKELRRRRTGNLGGE